MRFIPFTIRDRAIRMSGWEPGGRDGQHVEGGTARYLDLNQKTIPSWDRVDYYRQQTHRHRICTVTGRFDQLVESLGRCRRQRRSLQMFLKRMWLNHLIYGTVGRTVGSDEV